MSDKNNGYQTPDAKLVQRRRATKSGGERAPPSADSRQRSTAYYSSSPAATFQDRPPAFARQRMRAKKTAGVIVPPAPPEQPPSGKLPAAAAGAVPLSSRGDGGGIKRARKTVGIGEYASLNGEPRVTRAKQTAVATESHTSEGESSVVRKKLRSRKVATEISTKRTIGRSAKKDAPPVKATTLVAKKPSSRLKENTSCSRPTSSGPAKKSHKKKKVEPPEVEDEMSVESDDSTVVDMPEDVAIPQETSAIILQICSNTTEEQKDKQEGLLRKLLGQDRRSAENSWGRRAARTFGSEQRGDETTDFTLDYNDIDNVIYCRDNTPENPPLSVWVPIQRSFWTADETDRKAGKTEIFCDLHMLRKREGEYGSKASQKLSNAKVDVALRRMREQLGDISGYLNFISNTLGEKRKTVLQRYQATTMAKPKDPPVAPSFSSFRELWCQKCLVYSCRRHGIPQKPEASVELVRTKLMLEKESDGKWDASTPTDLDESKLAASLSEGQKDMFAQVFYMFEGDLTNVARFLGVPVSVATEYCTANDVSMVPEALLKPIDFPVDPSKDALDFYSVEQYPASRYTAYSAFKVRPEASPCYHEGLCNEKNCSCIQNGHFCTTACMWGRPENSNFFRGCNCKGHCFEDDTCPCFGAGRECDPNLCACRCCSGRVGEVLQNNRRNDHIFMQRDAAVAIRKSTVEGAGWGCFSLTGLRSGDYVGEFVGELISACEAEQRSAIRDGKHYMIELVSNSIVDSYKYGNSMRFINQSDDSSNVKPRVLFVEGEQRIGVFATQDVMPGEELFADYKHIASLEEKDADTTMDRKRLSKRQKT